MKRNYDPIEIAILEVDRWIAIDTLKQKISEKTVELKDYDNAARAQKEFLEKYEEVSDDLAVKLAQLRIKANKIRNKYGKAKTEEKEQLKTDMIDLMTDYFSLIKGAVQ